MKTIIDLAPDAIAMARVLGREIFAFLVTAGSWNEIIDPHVIPDPFGTEKKLMGIPVEVFPSLLACAQRAMCLESFQHRLGWVLNPRPFENLEVKPAFDCYE
jgi:hypothetical protein